MASRNILIIAVAVFLGLIAVYLGNAYFSGVESRQEEIAKQNQLARIVVASQDMAFGTQLSTQNVRLVNWPQNSVPTGAFTSIEDATKNRVALRPIVVGEPVLASKVSGTNGRATISANLPEGMLAYTVGINDVAGVGGYARPGDVVDVLLTRQIPGNGAQANDKMTDVVLQAVPVIGIDQIADPNNTNPTVGKTATLQVSTLDAQKLALASQLGVLSLALRNVADPAHGLNRTVIPRDLTASRFSIGTRNGSSAPPARTAPLPRLPGTSSGLPPMRSFGPSMTVVRGTSPTEYEVRRGY
jgi:pilus assembly protein CpaB